MASREASFRETFFVALNRYSPLGENFISPNRKLVVGIGLTPANDDQFLPAEKNVNVPEFEPVAFTPMLVKLLLV